MIPGRAGSPMLYFRMKHFILLLEICGVLVFAFLLWVSGPTVKSKIEAAWMPHPQQPQLQPQPQPQAQTDPQTHSPKLASVKPTPNKTTPPPAKTVSYTSPSALTEPNPDPPAAAPAPKIKFASYRLLPSQAVNLRNVDFRDVVIRSEYPVSVVVGNCSNTYTVQWHCKGDPADVFITDTRKQPLFLTPKANPVSVTAREF